MIPLLGALGGGGGLSVDQTTKSGLGDLSNTSRSGESAGYTGSVVNNFALGGSKLSSEFGAVGGDAKTFLWIGLAVLGVLLIWYLRKMR